MTNIKAVVADARSLMIHNVDPRPDGWLCVAETDNTLANWFIACDGWEPPHDHVGDACRNKDTPVVIVAQTTSDAVSITKIIQQIREQS